MVNIFDQEEYTKSFFLNTIKEDLKYQQHSKQNKKSLNEHLKKGTEIQ